MIKMLLLTNIVIAAMISLLIIKYGHYLGLVDYPQERSSHFQPVPKGGALGILTAFLITALFLHTKINIWAPAVAIGLVGFWSDQTEVSPKIRLFIQLLLALLFLFVLPEPILGVAFSILILLFLALYIVGTTNFYNFMDGINGISAITGIIAFSLLGYFSVKINTDIRITLLLFSLGFACLGFLPFNFPKAKVFMGDVGSTSLGFFFACMVVYLARNINEFFILLAFLFPFYADELTTMFIRIKDRENLTKAHRRHLYQLLANEGHVPHWQVSLGYGAVQLLIALLALYLRRYGLSPILLMLLLAFSGFVVVSVQVRKKLEPVKTGYSN